MSLSRSRPLRVPWKLIILAAVICVLWTISPWLYLSGLRVEAVRVLKAGEADGSRTPAGLATSERIKVSFTTPQELVAYRAKWGLPFIQAQITACNDDAAGSNDEVITQGAGYFSDYVRVRALGRIPGIDQERYRYEAVFDNRLSSIVNHEGKDTPASTVPGGLCFRVHGATIFSGSVRSAKIPLVIDRR